MEYPKHIYLIWLVIIFLAGYILLSLEWIGHSVFIGLFLFSLPIYWLETKWRNQSIRNRIKKGELWVFPFKEWNWERLLYWQFVATFTITLPGMFFDLEGVSILQVALAYLFIAGLIASKYYRERNELQSIQLDSKKWLVNNCGMTKKLFWSKINAFHINGNLLTAQQSGDRNYVIDLGTLEVESREVLLSKVRNLSSKAGIPLKHKVGTQETKDWSNLKANWWMGVIFMFFLVLNVLAVFDFVSGLIN